LVGMPSHSWVRSSHFDSRNVGLTATTESVSQLDVTAKRARLIEAAKTLLHQQGLYRTTLADGADRARIPLGNVYYYFRRAGDPRLRLPPTAASARSWRRRARIPRWPRRVPG
jgi:hypothetical protein